MSTFVQAPPYLPVNKIRVVTAALLFEGRNTVVDIASAIVSLVGLR
jgi:hypothetical protein